MKTLLVVLFITLFSLVYSQQKLPNIGYLGLGYDYIKASPFDKTDSGFLNSNVFEYSYSGGRTTPDGRYSIPDGVDVVPISQCSYDTNAEKITSLESFKENVKTNVEVSASFPAWCAKVAFSVSVLSEKIREKTESREYEYTSAQAKCQVYAAGFQEFASWTISNNLMQGIKSLPWYYSRAEYSRFLNAFGQGYVASMTMGGKATQMSEMSRVNIESLERQHIDVKVAASLSLKNFTGSAKVEREEDKEQRQKFEQARSWHCENWVGGEPPKNGDIHDWITTVRQEPMPVKYEIRPIYELFTRQYLPMYNSSVLDALTQSMIVALKCQATNHTAEECGSVKPECKPVCSSHGRCVGQNHCQCEMGWQGQTCSEPVCDPPCLNGGNCTEPNVCKCPKQYSGDYCEKKCNRECVNFCQQCFDLGYKPVCLDRPMCDSFGTKCVQSESECKKACGC